MISEEIVLTDLFGAQLASCDKDPILRNRWIKEAGRIWYFSF